MFKNTHAHNRYIRKKKKERKRTGLSDKEYNKQHPKKRERTNETKQAHMGEKECSYKKKQINNNDGCSDLKNSSFECEDFFLFIVFFFFEIVLFFFFSLLLKTHRYSGVFCLFFFFLSFYVQQTATQNSRSSKYLYSKRKLSRLRVCQRS